MLIVAQIKPPLPKGSEAADAVVNDNPVDCQSRGMTDPQGEGGPRVAWWRDFSAALVKLNDI